MSADKGDYMAAQEQEAKVSARAEEHANAARDALYEARRNGISMTERALIEALLAIEGRLNEIAYRLNALEFR